MIDVEKDPYMTRGVQTPDTERSSKDPTGGGPTAQRSGGIISWLRSLFKGWGGPRWAGLQQYLPPLPEERLADYDPNQMPPPQTPTDYIQRNEINAGPLGVALPWILPYMDEHTEETPEIRMAYRTMWRDPYIKAAVLGKILGVALLKVRVKPAGGLRASKENIRAADLVDYNLQVELEGGMPNLIWSILSGALTDGYSVCSKVIAPVTHGRWAQSWVIQKIKPLNVGVDVAIRTDRFLNVIDVMGLRYNAGRYFHPGRFLIYRNLPLYNNPIGMSDFRAVYSRFWMMDTLLKLRMVAAEKRTLPFLVGEYVTTSQKPSLEQMLAAVKSQNWAAVPQGVKISVLDMAGQASAVFDKFITDLKHDIFLGLQGAMLQAIEGSVNSGRGNSEVHQDTAGLWRTYIARTVEAALNDSRWGLVRDIVDMNMVVSEYPRVYLEDADMDRIRATLDVDERLSHLVPLSRRELYETYGRRPPESPQDKTGGPPDDNSSPSLPGLPKPPVPPVPPGMFAEKDELPETEDSPEPEALPSITIPGQRRPDTPSVNLARSQTSPAATPPSPLTASNKLQNKAAQPPLTASKKPQNKAAQPPLTALRPEDLDDPAVPDAPETLLPSSSLPDWDLSAYTKKQPESSKATPLPSSQRSKPEPFHPAWYNDEVEEFTSAHSDYFDEIYAKNMETFSEIWNPDSGYLNPENFEEWTQEGITAALLQVHQKLVQMAKEGKFKYEPRFKLDDSKTLNHHRRTMFMRLDYYLKDSRDLLGEDKFQLYRQSLIRSVSRMPKRAISLAYRNIGRVWFYPDAEQLDFASNYNPHLELPRYILNLARKFKHIAPLINHYISFKDYLYELKYSKPNFITTGMYSRAGGDLYLDGGHSYYPVINPYLGEDDPRRPINDPMEIYLHELGHAIDGPHNVLSETPEFQEVFSREIQPLFPTGVRLTQYAQTQSAEGFAEAIRLVYNGKVDRDHFRLRMPLLTAFLQEQGLWPEEGTRTARRVGAPYPYELRHQHALERLATPPSNQTQEEANVETQDFDEEFNEDPILQMFREEEQRYAEELERQPKYLPSDLEIFDPDGPRHPFAYKDCVLTPQRREQLIREGRLRPPRHS